MKRLLCIVGVMDMGGAETFLMKLYRELDRNKYQMDFCVSTGLTGCYEEEISLMGGRIFKIPKKSENFIQYSKELRKIYRSEKYERVLRIGADCFCAIDLWIAFFSGVKIRAFRSSNSGTIQNRLISFLHKMLRIPLTSIANVKIAPSRLAAEYTFGKSRVKKNQIIYLHNALDVKQYEFNENNRRNIRKQLNIGNEIVIGHIGRFNKQKNHEFLINVFNKLKNKNLKLILVGKGELENQIRDRIEELQIADKVILAGTRKDIPKFLSAIDLIVFPSYFEGMPNVIIEAQVNGIPCIISSTITKEVNITGLVEFLPLDDINLWTSEIEKKINQLGNRRSYIEEFERSGYTIDKASQIFIESIFY